MWKRNGRQWSHEMTDEEALEVHEAVMRGEDMESPPFHPTKDPAGMGWRPSLDEPKRDWRWENLTMEQRRATYGWKSEAELAAEKAEAERKAEVEGRGT